MPLTLPVSETRLLAAALKSRQASEEIFSQIDAGRDLSPLGSIVAQLVSEFYDRDGDAQSCELDSILARLSGRDYSEKQHRALRDFIGALPESISVPNLLGDIRTFRRDRLGNEIALALANRGDAGTIARRMEEYLAYSGPPSEEGELLSGDSEIYQGHSVSELVKKSFTQDSLIHLVPKELDEKIDGGCRPGHHILVYARPEIGKTLFVINLIAGFLAQKLKVLYVGNEDPASDILLRVVGRLSRFTKSEILSTPDKAEELALEKGYGNLVVASLAPGTFRDIEALVAKYEPRVVLLDQLRNISVSSDSRVQGLEEAATSARNLAKRRGIVCVSVTQAGESAEGKAILGRDDIDFSKTGIPAQVDLMIGIGADPNMERLGIRTISLPKNKLSGNHDHFTITINPQISLVEGAK